MDEHVGIDGEVGEAGAVRFGFEIECDRPISPLRFRRAAGWAHRVRVALRRLDLDDVRAEAASHRVTIGPARPVDVSTNADVRSRTGDGPLAHGSLPYSASYTRRNPSLQPTVHRPVIASRSRCS